MFEINVVLFLVALAVHFLVLPKLSVYMKLPPKRQALVSLGLTALLVTEGWTGALIYRDVRDGFHNADPVVVWQSLEDYAHKRAAEQRQQLESLTPRQQPEAAK